MLELQPKPQFSIVVPPKLLQEGYLVTFPTTWPSQYKYVTGKTFRIDVAVQVPYDLGYNLPTGDYRDVDFSNTVGTFAEFIYPTNAISLFEVAIGFKPGRFLTEWFIPAGVTRHALEGQQMAPDITNAKRLFLGQFTAKDSPYDDPRIKAYFVKDFTPLIMRIFVHGALAPAAGAAFEQVVAGLVINKCKLREITDPTNDQLAKAKVIRYYDEMKW